MAQLGFNSRAAVKVLNMAATIFSNGDGWPRVARVKIQRLTRGRAEESRKQPSRLSPAASAPVAATKNKSKGKER